MPKGRKVRKMKNYFIVTFNDLTDKKQDEIIRAMVRDILDEGHDEDNEADAREKAEKIAVEACARTSYSWEIEVKK